MNPQTPFLNYLVAEGLLSGPDFFLVDVGASGGIDPLWSAFGPHLRAVGFDPLVNEVERLNRRNGNPKVNYVDAFVGSDEHARRLPPEVLADKARSRSNHSHPRSSSLRAEALGAMNFQQEIFNSGQEMVFSSRRLELDQYFTEPDRGRVDFVKIDTDGSDYPVLLGARELLGSGGVLGLTIECQFHGPVHDDANLFCNIDRFLRARGFSLYDLEVHRYSRAELPLPFVYDIPAQTLGGQIQWGEAVYFRDLADPEYGRMWGRDFELAKRLKLACLFELFHLPDCAVELLLRHRAELESLIPVDRCLDLLTPPYLGQRVRFRDHDQEFVHWASRRKWLAFGREKGTASEPAPTGPGDPRFDLAARIGHLLGRKEPVAQAELEEAHAILNLLLNAKDASRELRRLQTQLPPALRPLLLYHLGLAVKEGNADLAEVLELIHARLSVGAGAHPDPGQAPA